MERDFIQRFYKIDKLLKPQKVLVIYGPRRAGKTTFLMDFLNRTKLKYKLDSGDNFKIQQMFSSQDFYSLKEYSAGYDLIAIDEAQQIPQIGMALKILVDQVEGLMVIATGSSSFDLSQKIGEPLTGRKKTITLYPFSQTELLAKYNKYELKEQLENFLIFGSYPEAVNAITKKEKIAVLEEIVGSYLLKDALSIEKIKGASQLMDLLKLVAFQVGKEVVLSELAQQVRLDVKTVGRYLDILEKCFVLKKIGGLGRNLRKEITSKARYYFWDNGVRNAVVSQFNGLKDRDDVGLLFENFMVMERLKANEYQERYGSVYFWRTYDGQEIDFVEERDNKFFAFEFKWSNGMKKPPSAWLANYPNSEYKIVSRENYLDFLL
ncbi:MAG: ATP-binding protein [Patescibacteria group bacterium]